MPAPPPKTLSQDDLDQMEREDWRELGFYYHRNNALQRWDIFANQQGFLRLAEELQEYAQSLGKIMGEHDHIEPDWSLTLTTSAHYFINDRGIYGTAADFEALATHIVDTVSHLHAGQVHIINAPKVDVYSYALYLLLQDDDFDAASMMPRYR